MGLIQKADLEKDPAHQNRRLFDRAGWKENNPTEPEAPEAEQVPIPEPDADF